MPEQDDKGNSVTHSLPTGKSHISFSELATWLDCPFKHKLVYIDKLGTFDGNEHTNFGKLIHEGCESFITTGTMNSQQIVDKIDALWDTMGYSAKDTWIASADAILNELPTWMQITFPNWKPLVAEQQLFELLDHIGHDDTSWKGYVDAAIKYKNPRGKELVYILDWKTTSWGWHVNKLRDFKTNAQIAAYKIFWSRKYDIDVKDIRAAYVLLKRTVPIGSTGKRCQLVNVSVGPKMILRVNNTIDKMLRSVKNGYAPRNRLSCKYCEFANTDNCPGSRNDV